MDIEAIKAQMREGNFVVSAHADQAVADEGLDIAEIRDTILDGEILENYDNTGRGPSWPKLTDFGFRERHANPRGLWMAPPVSGDHHRICPETTQV